MQIWRYQWDCSPALVSSRFAVGSAFSNTDPKVNGRNFRFARLNQPVIREETQRLARLPQSKLTDQVWARS
jgi:hypothetical protein